MTDLEQYMREYIKTCDYYTDDNTDDIHYDDCSECYRYEICKKCAKNEYEESRKALEKCGALDFFKAMNELRQM